VKVEATQRFQCREEIAASLALLAMTHPAVGIIEIERKWDSDTENWKRGIR